MTPRALRPSLLTLTSLCLLGLTACIGGVSDPTLDSAERDPLRAIEREGVDVVRDEDPPGEEPGLLCPEGAADGVACEPVGAECAIDVNHSCVCEASERGAAWTCTPCVEDAEEAQRACELAYYDCVEGRGDNCERELEACIGRIVECEPLSCEEERDLHLAGCAQDLEGCAPPIDCETQYADCVEAAPTCDPEPCDPSTDPGCAELTVQSFNIASHMACSWPSGCLYTDPRPMLQIVADTVVDEDVDLLGVQEIDVGTQRHLGLNMVALLQQYLADRGHPMAVRYAPRRAIDGGTFGQAIFTRYPIVSYSSQLYPVGGFPPVLQEMVVEVGAPGHELRFFNTHVPTGPTKVGFLQDVVLPALQAHLDEDTVIAGDFNLRPQTNLYTWITATHVDSCALSGDPTCVNTVHHPFHPNGNGNPSRIDYVFHRFGARDYVMLDAWVDPDINSHGVDVSDHYPAYARYVIPE